MLPYRHAKRFMKRELTKELWEGIEIPRNDRAVLNVLRHRMPETWGAANAKKTAHVSLCFTQFEILLWFLGRDHEEAHWRMWDRFEHYGKPQLAWLCEEYDLGDWHQWDDGRWHMTVLNAALPAEDALTRWRKNGQPFVSKCPATTPLTDPEAPSTPSSSD
jgi:hypothetical protein